MFSMHTFRSFGARVGVLISGDAGPVDLSFADSE